MGAREYLEQLHRLDDKVRLKEIEIEWMKRRESVKGLTEDAKEKIERHEREAVNYIESLLDFEIKVARQLLEVEDYRFRMVLQERYMFGKKWEEVAEEHHYSVPALHYIHNQALEEFDKVLQVEEEQNK